MAVVVSMPHEYYAEYLLNQIEEYKILLEQQKVFLDTIQQWWWYRWLFFPGFPVRWFRQLAIDFSFAIVERSQELLQPPRPWMQICQEAKQKRMDFWLMMAEGVGLCPKWIYKVLFFIYFILEASFCLFFYILIFNLLIRS
jgi:hypothetical protein